MYKIDFFYDIKRENGQLFKPPWCIGREQPFINNLISKNCFISDTLDIGSGDGYNAIAIYKKNINVHGIERVPTAFNYCQENSVSNDIQKDIFFQLDFFKDNLPSTYNTILDIAFFHGLKDIYIDEYLSKLDTISNPNAKLIVVTVELTSEIKHKVLSNEFFYAIEKLTGKDFKKDILLGSLHYNKDDVLKFYKHSWEAVEIINTEYLLKGHNNLFYSTNANVFIFNKK